MVTVIAIAAVSIVGALVIYLISRFYWDSDYDARDSGTVRQRNPFAGQVRDGVRGEPRVCPICAALFEHGEMVKSKIFPSTGKQDRLMNILGCPYCRNGERIRKCPVCDAELGVDEYLTARVFDRPEKMHVHVLGCNHCRLR
jgi:uncharacterized protein YbaR (Trm112 family)